MTSNELIKNIRSYCRANGKPENVVKYSRYFKGGFIGYGLDSKQIYSKKDILTKGGAISLQTVLSAAEELIPSPMYEEPSIIMLLLLDFKNEFTLDTFLALEKWYPIGIRNWAHADTMGMMILPVFLSKKIISPEDFRPWIKSDFSYQRRSVPVTFVKYLKETEKYSKLFKITEPLMMDSSREVQQGQGWFLREAWKKQPEITEEVLTRWKDRSPRLIFQYACEKMEKTYRKKFARAK